MLSSTQHLSGTSSRRISLSVSECYKRIFCLNSREFLPSKQLLVLPRAYLFLSNDPAQQNQKSTTSMRRLREKESSTGKELFFFFDQEMLFDIFSCWKKELLFCCFSCFLNIDFYDNAQHPHTSPSTSENLS